MDLLRLLSRKDIPEDVKEYLRTHRGNKLLDGRAEEALGDESRIKSISNNLTDGMIYQVVIAPDGKRRFTYLSGSVQKLYGVSPEEGMADASLLYKRIHEDDVELLRKAEDEAVRALSTFKAEVRINAPTGEIRWSSFVSTPRLMEDGSTCFEGIEFIITERKRAEEALRESEARLNEAQRVAHIGSWALNILTNTLTWSAEVFNIFEIDRERFGATYEAFLAAIHPDDRDAVNTAYMRSLKTCQSYGITHRILMPDGRVKYVQEQCENYYSPDGKPSESYMTLQSASGRKARFWSNKIYPVIIFKSPG